MLLHILTEAELRAVERSGSIAPQSLRSEGFVHCSFADQVHMPANAFFAARTDLWVAVIDPGLVDAEVVVEDSYGTGVEFPHVYGPIPLTAVVRFIEYVPDATGAFGPPHL